jgi:hypothetical protein
MGAECPYDEDPLIKVSASVSKHIAYRIFAALVTKQRWHKAERTLGVCLAYPNGNPVR